MFIYCMYTIVHSISWTSQTANFVVCTLFRQKCQKPEKIRVSGKLNKTANSSDACKFDECTHTMQFLPYWSNSQYRSFIRNIGNCWKVAIDPKKRGGVPNPGSSLPKYILFRESVPPMLSILRGSDRLSPDPQPEITTRRDYRHESCILHDIVWFWWKRHIPDFSSFRPVSWFGVKFDEFRKKSEILCSGHQHVVQTL